MSSTPKWYCRNKSQQASMHGPFAEISKLGNELRRITKRILIDVKVDIFNEQDVILAECEQIVDTYWSLKDETKSKEFLSLSKKIKRSPYNALLISKYNKLMALNDQRFYQLVFVLKKTLTYLLRKSLQSEIWFNWALQITDLYNKCINRMPADTDTQMPDVYKEKQQQQQQQNTENANDVDMEKQRENKEKPANSKEKKPTSANICSNLYPALRLTPKPIDFSYVLQLVSQTHVEQNALDLMFGLFNLGDQHDVAAASAAAPTATWPDDNISTSSSLEILRILTLNMMGDGEFQQYYDSTVDNSQVAYKTEANGAAVNQRNKHTEHFLEKERKFIAHLIVKANELCPSLFNSSSKLELKQYINRGMRLIWSYVGIILDHIILWWIDTPISCYPLAHVDSIRNWLQSQSVHDIPEPVYSTLRGIGEILTNFVCNNIWDQLFRLTLMTDTTSMETVEYVVKQYKGAPINSFGTASGTVWIQVFSNLINLSNNYFPRMDISSTSSLPIAEQIPILHRLDHSVHSMRLWVMEQAKRLCSMWKMGRFFQILEHDVKICLNLFSTIKLPKLTADLTDILVLVNTALRTKLVFEVNANIDKLNKTTDECVQILSAVCRILSLANFTLVFPKALYWQQKVYDNEEKSPYVGFILDQIYLPIIKATKCINILKLIMKIICEAWLDFIYERRIKFSVNGAVRLLNDFDDVREWILGCALLDEEHSDKLSNHEVLRMCKGVGKILLRKPEDIIAITQSPKYDKKSTQGDSSMQETQLPSEMFVSNQKHWLQLRANKSNFPFLNFCCGDV